MSWRLIRPDPPAGGELPATEFIHPLPLAALGLLAVNDHLLKGAGLLPGVVTGKLSDFTGLFFFPLLLTACLDVGLHGINWVTRRPRLDASLSSAKLIGAGLFTAVLFTSIKLSPTAAAVYGRLLRAADLLDLLPGIQIVQDPTDLMALPMIAGAFWFGRSRIGEIPPARLAWLSQWIRSGGEVETVLRSGLEDCRRSAGADAKHFEALVRDLGPWLEARAQGQAPAAARERAQRALTAWRESG